MRTPVKCENCGVKWERVTVFGPNLELTEDLQYNCPNCGSNWYVGITDDKMVIEVTTVKKS